jgi:hypothetical protein
MSSLNGSGAIDPSRPNVFIHTNHKQIVGALVSQYSMKRHSKDPDAFDVHLIQHEDYAWFDEYEDQLYLRDGALRAWRNDDLQSFTPLRFMPPELMGYQGRAVVTDPDVFAVGDVMELLSRDMKGNRLMCRLRSGAKGFDGILATSVMLLDCAQLTHWNVRDQFDAMFRQELDYQDWIGLKIEDRSKIELFEHEWNDFDRLTERTKLIHNTKRRTQPWKSGLPADFVPAEKWKFFPPMRWLLRARRKLFGDYAFVPDYRSHPDQRQEDFFFGLLRECVEKGVVTEDFIRDQMAKNHVRHDALEVLDRVQPLAA